jgi:hypothetical protein
MTSTTVGRARLFALVVTVGVTMSRQASAAEPSIDECLNASERTLQLQEKRKLRDAREQALVCASATCPAEIRTECARQVGELNAALPTVVFEARDEEGADLAAVTMTVDGAVVTERLGGASIELDVGEHVVVFESAGRATVRQTLIVREGEKNRRIGAVLKRDPPLPQPPPPPEAAPAGPSAPAPGPWRTVGITTALVGGAGLGLGTVFGLVASSRVDDARCSGNVCADEAHATVYRDAQSAGTLSTVFFVVGGLLVAGGVTTWLLAPKAGGPAVQAVAW